MCDQHDRSIAFEIDNHWYMAVHFDKNYDLQEEAAKELGNCVTSTLYLLTSTPSGWRLGAGYMHTLTELADCSSAFISGFPLTPSAAPSQP